ncbi:MAG: LuxR C-terminal-related transcriptional regulator [Ilumatobacteraceae bacterium]
MARVVTALPGSSSSRWCAALVRAPLGGGRSRVVEEIATSLAASGRSVRRILANSATASVPFGSVAHLLPVGARESADPLTLIGALRDVLAPAGIKRPVLVIDDVPLLDIATAGVIATLAASGEVDVVASARDDESLPEPLVDVLLGDRSMIVQLQPMTDEEIDTLLHLALGGPVDGGVVVSLRDRSEGNPLFLRELTRSAIDSGALVQVQGVWRMRGNPPGSTRLREVVESRLDIVGAEVRKALELLALCDIVDLDELESLVGLEALADLEERGLLRTLVRLGRQCATLSHPLHGEAIRMALPALRSRLLMRNHIAWIEQHTPATGGDALQRAIWRLDAGMPADLDSLLHGARLAAAMQDSRSVLRLAGPLFEQRPTASIGGMLGEALFQTGQWAEAFEVLDRTALLPSSPRLRVDLGVIRATILLWGIGDAGAALQTMDRLRADPEMSAEDHVRLNSQYASILVNAGLPGEARAELEAATTSDQIQTKLGAAVAYTNALAMAGRTEQAIHTIDEAMETRPKLGVTGVADVDVYMVAKAFAFTEAGRLTEAIEMAEEGYERAVMSSRPLTQFWFSLSVGRNNLFTGSIATSLRMFTSARALGLDAGLRGPVRSALTGMAIGHAMLGDLDAATAAIAEREKLPPFAFMSPERALADGWAAVARGDLVEARRVLDLTATEAFESGHICTGIWLLHDVARLGAPAAVLDRLVSFAATTDSAFAAARAAHVVAMVAGDLPGLVGAADQFESIGAQLLAGEACVAAAELARAAGDQRAAAALTVRAERHVGLCEGATSPGLIASVGTVEPLTEREREIAFMAANGLTSREIAETLFVSMRTVSNHLQHIYDKLGVRSRSDLRAALDLGRK